MCKIINEKNNGVDPVPKGLHLLYKTVRNYRPSWNESYGKMEKNEWSIARTSSRKSVVINYEIHPSVELRPIMAAEFENFFLQPSICETSQTRRPQEDRKTAVKFYDRIGGKRNGEYVRIISFSRLQRDVEEISRSFSKFGIFRCRDN